MSFYEQLSRYYDQIFPVRATQTAFFQQNFLSHRTRTVLDLACGTGNYALEFARWGLEVTGVDLDAAMLERAREKAATLELPVEFRPGDMRSLTPWVGNFDAVVCIGNSLAHLLTPTDAAAAVGEMVRVLNPGGFLCLQLVNYDKLAAQGGITFPRVEIPAAGIIFERSYAPAPGGLLRFQMLLRVRDEGEFADAVLLRPVTAAELRQAIEAAGGQNIRLLGSFASEPFTLASPALIAVASR